MSGLQAFETVFGQFTIGSIVELAIAIGFIIAVFKKLKSYFADKAKEDASMYEQMKKILDSTNRIPMIESRIEELEKNYDLVKGQLQAIETDARRRECSQLRGRLLDAYRYYVSDAHNPMKAITELEKKAFDNIFIEYKHSGGDGYIDSEVIPAVAELEVIPMNDPDRLKELMLSRK